MGYNRGKISDSYATTSVAQGRGGATGGLVGCNWNGSIVRSYASADVTGETYVGGLAGVNSASITDSYATGRVAGTGLQEAGGLVGLNSISGKIINSYATGSVKGMHREVGGLAGANNGVPSSGGGITNSFATGVATSDTPGGLIGEFGGTQKNNWWYNGVNTAGVGAWPSTGVSKADGVGDFYGAGSLPGGAVYTNSAATGQPSNAWNFANTWRSVAGALPRLKWEP